MTQLGHIHPTLRAIHKHLSYLREKDRLQIFADCLARRACLSHADRETPEFWEAIERNDLAPFPPAPHPFQAAALASNAKQKLLICGNQSAKTTSIVIDIMLAMMCLHPFWSVPPGRYIIVGPNDDHLKAVTWESLSEWEGPGWRSRKADMTWTYEPNGSVVRLLSNKSDVDAFSGDRVQAIAFDEEPSKEVIDEARMRTAKFAGRLLFGLTPVKGADCVYDELILPWRKGSFADGVPVRPSPIGAEMQRVRAYCESEGLVAPENATIVPGNRAKVEALAIEALRKTPLPQWTRAAAIRGEVPNLDVFEWDTDDHPIHTDDAVVQLFEGKSPEVVRLRRKGKIEEKRGLALPELKPEIHGAPADWLPTEKWGAQHWNIVRGYDWGSTNPMCLLWVAVGPDDVLVVYREFYQAHRTIPQLRAHCDMVELPATFTNDKEPIKAERERIEVTYVEQPERMHGSTGAHDSVFDKLVEHGFDPQTVPHNRRQGFMLLKDALYPQPRDRIMPWHDAANPPERLPRLYISRACRETWRTLTSLKLDTYATKLADRNAKEEPVKAEDHAFEALMNVLIAAPMHSTGGPRSYWRKSKNVNAESRR